MSSIYAKAMGSDFAKLHPQIQKRFGFGSADKIASIGFRYKGTFDVEYVPVDGPDKIPVHTKPVREERRE